jgi:DNA-directed RNA polymerase specialized sigma24 family protein
MSDNEKKPPEDEEDAPDSGEGASDEDDEPVEGDDPSAPPLDPAVVHAFLASKKARDVAKAAIAKKIPAQEVGELVSQAIEDALTADPPHVEAALVSWLYKIAERRAADWLRKRKRRRKYEGAMPTQSAREDDYTGARIDDDADGEAAPAGYSPDQDDDPGEMVGDHLLRLIGGNAKELEVVGWIREHAGGKSFKQIAAERRLTEAQIANRIYRLKLKYQKPIQRRRQRMLLVWLFGGAAAVVVAAAIVWWLFFRDEHSYYKPVTPPSANPAATAERGGPNVSHPAPDDDAGEE